MNAKKAMCILAAIIFLCVCAFGIAAVSWTRTPRGRLDLRAAMLLKYIEYTGHEAFKPGQTIEDSRRAVNASRIMSAKGMPVAELRDTSFQGTGGEVKVRIYRPEKDGLLPVVVFYHGGGWVLGDLDTYDTLCRAISNAVRAVVVSVDYRLAPEHGFPAGVDDAYAGLVWAHANAGDFGGDAARIALAGCSAGGNLAAVVAIMARDRKGPLVAQQTLMYPATDLAHLTTGSYRNFAKGYYLTKRYMEKVREMYVPDRGKWSDPLVSPLLARDLRGLPPAFVITAEFDPLRDEGEAYARRMHESGVEVRVRRFPGIIHGFLAMDRLFPQTGEAVELIAAEMRKHLAPRER
jgi:acetyl esterase